MRSLVDAQVPPALARWLEHRWHTAEHVAECGMAKADDHVIWDYAHAMGAVIVTKDEDFAIRRALVSEGPFVVWIRRGNTTRRDLLTWFGALCPAVLDALGRGEPLVQIV